jgi:5-methylcytosine-specific restriction enzyme subunit McrC
MLQVLKPNHLPTLEIELTEWDRREVLGISFAQNESARRSIIALGDRLEVREGYAGLEILSTSFVGRIDIGQVRIAIAPKLPAIPLTVLLRYAYGLRDVSLIHQTEAQVARLGFHDLLISLLAGEAEELLHRGLARRYVPEVRSLQSPRGRILIGELSWYGGIAEARSMTG